MSAKATASIDRMRIWPVAGTLSRGDTAAIEGSDARHITEVLRKGTSDLLEVCDSAARVFTARIETTAIGRVTITIIGETGNAVMKKPDLFLALSIGKMPVLELVTQKAVELGCAGLYLLASERSVGKTVSPQKLDRLRRISHEACKQCGRGAPMPLFGPVPAEQLAEADAKILLWEDERDKTLRDALAKFQAPSSVLLVVGPAGGFSAGEAAAFRGRGFLTAGLGPLVLRAETAAIALLAVADYHFGKWEGSR